MFFFLSLINVKVSRAYLSKELDNFTKILIGIEFCLSLNTSLQTLEARWIEMKIFERV